MHFLNSPALLRSAGGANILSAAVIAGAPLVITNVPPAMYWIALALLVISQAIQLAAAERARVYAASAQDRFERGQTKVARQVVRTAVNEACAGDPIARSSAADILWAVRVSSEDGVLLLEANYDSLDVSQLGPLKFGARRVVDCGLSKGFRVIAASDMHRGTGRRYEFFYHMPAALEFTQCRPLADDVIDRLMNSDVLVALLASVHQTPSTVRLA